MMWTGRIPLGHIGAGLRLFVVAALFAASALLSSGSEAHPGGGALGACRSTFG